MLSAPIPPSTLNPLTPNTQNPRIQQHNPVAEWLRSASPPYAAPRPRTTNQAQADF